MSEELLKALDDVEGVRSRADVIAALLNDLDVDDLAVALHAIITKFVDKSVERALARNEAN